MVRGGVGRGIFVNDTVLYPCVCFLHCVYFCVFTITVLNVHF